MRYQLLILLLLIPCVHGQQYHMKLLAVSDSPDGLRGRTADLFLEIADGSGHTYIDTFPLTKLDTQMSTRFGREVACDLTNVDCRDKDFFYTIRSNSAIIGGPSAGAAITLLTIAYLQDIGFDDKITISGTINAGGLIGPVGGLKAKIEAAADSNLSKVLIATGERIYNVVNLTNGSINQSNVTIDLYEFGQKLGIEVVEVATIEEALSIITNTPLFENNKSIAISRLYTDTMYSLSLDLCNRSETLGRDVKNRSSAEYNSSLELMELAVNASMKGQYYSAASFCFGANLRRRYAILEEMDLKPEEVEKLRRATIKALSIMEKDLASEELTTIGDLQTYIVVNERLVDAKKHLKDNTTNESLFNVAYSLERLYSARSWSTFFSNPGKALNLNQEVLRESCLKKLSEAEERYQYANIMFPNLLENTRVGLDRAAIEQDSENYELCLFKASKAKAEANLILSSTTIKEEKLANYLSLKLDLIEKQIIKQQEKGLFPILGYSYYEYSRSLKDTNPGSALIYSEYALEFSNLDMYFKPTEKLTFAPRKDSYQNSYILLFIVGIVTGAILMLLIQRLTRN